MESARFPSRGGYSVRGIIAFALAVFMTALLWATLAPSISKAQDAPQATWNGAAIEYDGKQFIRIGEATASTGLGIPEGSPYYGVLETQAATGTTPASQKAFIIYFSPGTDPPTADQAQYAEYTYDATTRTYSDRSNVSTITLQPAGTSSAGSSCAVESVGWIVCPVANFLASGMDYIFYLLSGFMEVQPLQLNNTSGGLYVAWNVMRAVANIAFIIVFLIIIYAQITSVAISNYGIKRMLPRLIIAAIGVNISFLICAAAIDASNIIGYSLHGIFMDMRTDLINGSVADDGGEMLSWESITGFVLSGGTATLALGVGTAAAIIGSGGVVLGAMYLLLPALLGLILAVLVVLLILAARQALIVILVIVAPLAIVAYLLPNTEKWFDKWRGLFLTLLVFFPAFAVVFGGAQLAGAVIIQNASSINMLILGMIVQIAPLVITPLLLKFSGSLIGGIAKLVNNPNKGLLDRTRNWSKSHADWQRKRGIGGLDRKGNERKILDKNGVEIPGGLGKRNVLRKTSRYLDQRARRRSDRTAIGETATQNSYESSKRNAIYDKKGNLVGGVAMQKAVVDSRKDAIHSHHAADLDKARRDSSSTLFAPAYKAEAQKERAEASKNYTAAFYDNARRDKKLAGGALHASSYQLELSKDKAQTSENRKTEYFATERTRVGSDLRAGAIPLETSKLRLETANNNYTAMVDTLKATGTTSAITVAASRAQSSKDHLEVAQGRLQAHFDAQRIDVTTELGQSTIGLQDSKLVVEKSSADLAAYIANEKSSGSLRRQMLQSESAKTLQQIAETRLSSVITEFNSAQIDPADLQSPEEAAIMESMHSNTIRLSAEKRRVDSAQYEVQRSFADVMTGVNGDDPIQAALTEEMRTIAQGVGGDTARVRAISNAVATARGLDNDALKANVDLLKDEAKRKGTNIKYYSKDIIDAVLANKSVLGDVVLTPERIKAALQAQAEEKNIPLFEKVGGSELFDHAVVREIMSINSIPFKGAGGFAMQDKLMTLSDFVTDFSDPQQIAEGKKAYQYQLSLDHISNLANANATGIADWKMGEVVEVAKNLEEDIKASLSEIARGSKPNATAEDRAAAEAARQNLKAAYKTVRDALGNPDIVATMNDREDYVRTIEAELARLHGQQPTETKDFDLEFDADTYIPSASVRNAAKNLPENTEDTDENGNTPPPSRA